MLCSGNGSTLRQYALQENGLAATPQAGAPLRGSQHSGVGAAAGRRAGPCRLYVVQVVEERAAPACITVQRAQPRTAP